MRNTIRVGIPAILILGVCAAAAAAKPITLQYHWSAGQTLRYQITANLNGSLPLFGEPTPQPVQAKIVLTYLTKVTNVASDGTATLKIKVTSATLEIEDTPFDVPLDTVRKYLDVTTDISPSGAITNEKSGQSIPQGYNMPGFDPKRLFLLMFPVVFQSTPVNPGDTWEFPGQLIGGGATKKFEATLGPSSKVGQYKTTNINETFTVSIDQSLDSTGHPADNSNPPSQTRKGEVTGDAHLQFAPKEGRLIQAEMSFTAHLVTQTLSTPDKVKSSLKAKVMVQLLPNSNSVAPGTSVSLSQSQ
ncbi:MAG: hypothetical protein M1330_04265 [Armatimonadetes bacterium]|nr:hypothetical protein [Armatimonadota bacterium]